MKQEEIQRSRTEIRLADYQPPTWLLPRTELTFHLHPERTEVETVLHLERRALGSGGPIVLYGEGLELTEFRWDGPTLSTDPQPAAGKLELPDPGQQRCTVWLRTRINPQANTALEGLYMSAGKFCTQNEPEGFRHITFFPDRPDVMSRYRTTIIANQKEYPVLLSNGNPVERQTFPDGRHSVTWEDPFPKPSYLFALVAGDLGMIEDTHVTKSGRRVTLQIYTDHGAEERCRFAMQSLKDAMLWDEQTFGLEYDLDIYMIVAVEDFNFGAMENKGLNIFNSSLVLADPKTATDDAFERIQGVVAHEYFHNWTGNRVTCRDWFQLTLKEGLTVFRDQQFSADMTQPDLKRIYDVQDLREAQFPEDAGPMAHPIQPKSYIEINNFYTMTVYEKGAEVIRMIQTIIGSENFRRGLDLYFERHDGQAVTTEDFVAAMQDASGFDLSAFRRWYDAPGTPELFVESNYNPDAQELKISLKQSNPLHPDAALFVPVKVGLLGKDGRDLSFEAGFPVLPGDSRSDGLGSENDGISPSNRQRSVTLPLREVQQTFSLRGVSEVPVLSVLRGFSAPVHLKLERPDDQLAFLMAHDSDAFNRHEAGQQLATRLLTRAVEALQAGQKVATPALLQSALSAVLSSDLDESLRAVALSLPPESMLNQSLARSDFENVHRARESIITDLASGLKKQLASLADELGARNFANRLQGVGPRRLKNACLGFLMRLQQPVYQQRLLAQLERGENMTDELAALRMLCHHTGSQRDQATALFYERWQDESLVMNSWLAVQASSAATDTRNVVERLLGSSVFSWTNPNRVRALLGSFARNQLHFNAADGSGYELVADAVIKLDPINAHTASGLAKAFTRATKLDKKRQSAVAAALGRIHAKPGLSNDVFEIVSRCLAFES